MLQERKNIILIFHYVISIIYAYLHAHMYDTDLLSNIYQKILTRKQRSGDIFKK